MSTKNIDVDKELPNEQRSVRLHKVWMSIGMYYVLYSVNLKKDDRDPRDVPRLNFAEITMKGKDDDFVAFDTMQYDDDGRTEHDEYEGTVYDGRLYRSELIGIDIEKAAETDLDNYEDIYEDLIRTILGKASLNKDSNETDKNDKPGSPIENLSVNVEAGKDDDKIASIPIDQEVTIDNDQKIEFLNLDVTAFGNNLHFETNGDRDQKMHSIDVEVDWEGKDGEEMLYPANEILDEEDYFISTGSFNKIPDHMDVDMKSIIYTKSEDVSFEVSANPEKTKVSEQIGQVERMPFYFEGYTEPDDTSLENLIGMRIKWDATDHIGMSQGSLRDLVLQFDLRKQLEQMDNEEEKEWTEENASNVLVIKNGVGEKPKHKNIGGIDDYPHTKNSGDSTTIFIDKTFVEQSEKIIVTIKNFTYEREVENGHFQIDIPDEYIPYE